MKHRTIARKGLLLGILLAPTLMLFACRPAADVPANVPPDMPTDIPADIPTDVPARIGVYDSRAVALAWAGTQSFENWMGSLQSDYQKAKQAGDQKKVGELEAEAQARQRRLHLQVFSTAPVEDVLARIADSLPEVQKSAGVTMLVSKWDKETLARYPAAELVDVTMALVDALHPSEVQRQNAIKIQESEPIPLEEAENIEDW